MTSFITTAIPFVNAAPHLGFAYELVLADILARHRRRRGDAVRFCTGTDDNSLKNVVAASAAGIPTHDFVAANAAAFRALGPLLDLAPDDFVETSRDPRHRCAVEWLWRRCAASGDLYRRTWSGRYCAGCEAFLDDNVERCHEHDGVPEHITEDNWFFRLSRYRDPIRNAIASNRLRIVSESARAETLAFLDGEVRDVSVSRAATRAQGWGIPVPDDPSQVIYVWFDALTNYLSSLGLGSSSSSLIETFWSGAQTAPRQQQIHVIGKGIARFHAVYWPAFLLSAGVPLPSKIAVHGYLTVDGRKISKSNNPAPVPPIVERYGVDALRWHFARRCRTRADSDVPRDSLGDAYDSDLADRLGNLVQRTITLVAKLSRTDECDLSRVPAPRETPELATLRATAETVPARVDAALDAFLPDDAAAAIVELLDAANRYLEQVAPWKLARTDPIGALAALYAPLEAARFAAGELLPFVPDVSRTIAERLGDPDLAPTWGILEPGAALRLGAPPLPRKQPARSRAQDRPG